MGNMLQFTLGLETQTFLRGLGLASGGILSLATISRGLQVAMQGVWSAIERGGALNDLSARTGETVRSLYQMQEAFKIVGIGAEAVSPMIIYMQKAMSGVDEQGRRTDKVFAALGLDIERLRVMNAPAQFQAIAGALTRLDKSQATNVASMLFGREGAGNFLQIARDFGSFQQSFRDSAPAADIFARTAAIFDRIGDTLTTIKMKIGGFWAGLAEGAAPAIEMAEKFINSFDFISIGHQFGRVIAGIGAAISDGRLGEIIGDALKFGFDTLLDFAPAIFEQLGYFLLKAFETPLTYLQAGLEYVIDQAINNPKVRGVLEGLTGGASEAAFGLLGFGAPGQTTSFAQLLKERMEAGLEFNLGTGSFNLADINADAAGRMQNATAKLKERWKDLLAAMPDFMGGELTTAGPGAAVDIGGLLQRGGSKVDVSALEKIGFVIGGGRRDPVADNTREMVHLLRQLPTALAAKIGPAPTLRNS